MPKAADALAAEKQDEATREDLLLSVLDDTLAAVDALGRDYALIGGIASAVLGRPRVTRDIDLFVRAEDTNEIMVALDAAGFRTEQPDLDWLYKAFKDDVQVDVIFRGEGIVYLDDEMSDRIITRTYKGRTVRLVPPEDLLVMKALAHEEATPHYWHDALAIIAANELDWDYVLQRAQFGARRVLSLLVYAQSVDLVVPAPVIRSLFETIY